MVTADVEVPTKATDVVVPERLAHEGSDATAFECTLQPHADGLGLVYDVWPAYVQIVSVGAGSAQAHNFEAVEHEHLLPNDAIVTVSGCTEPETMRQQLESKGLLTLKCVRPSKLVATVSKGESKLGIDLAIHRTVGTCMWIEQVEDGAVQLYNSSVATTSQIRPQDLIQSVNGVEVVVSKMVEEIQSASVVELVVLRVPGTSSH